MEHILRDIKLSKLTGAPPVGDADKLVKFWDELWFNMKMSIDPKKGEIKCWKEGYNYYYFHQNDKNDNLWCDCDKVWSFPHHDLDLTYTESQELIQYMVSETLNCKVNKPSNTSRNPFSKVSETLNCKVNKPHSGITCLIDGWTRP